MAGSNAEQAISQEKYVSVATFRKTGVAVATATWIVPLDGGRVGLLTSSASGKAKRLRNNPSVTMQPSDVRGWEKSLVVADPRSGTTRYRLLETIRDYAWERLSESGEDHNTSERHCHHFLALAEELGPGLCRRDEPISREKIVQDLANFRTSLRWAIDADDAEVALRLVDALAIVGSLRSPYGSLPQRVAELSGANGHPLTPVALASAAAALSDQGDNRRAAALVDAALELAGSQKGTPAGDHAFCRVCGNVAMVTHIQSDMGRFVEMAKAWKEAAYELGDAFEISQALNLLGSLLDDPKEAMQACEESLRLARELGSPSRVAYSSIMLASRLALVDVDRAELVFAEALDAAVVARNDWVDLFAATQLALLQARRGEWTSAAKTLFEVAERSNRQGDHFGTIGALGHLAVLLAAMGANDAALLLGVWSENNQANLDTSHPLFVGCPTGITP